MWFIQVAFVSKEKTLVRKDKSILSCSLGFMRITIVYMVSRRARFLALLPDNTRTERLCKQVFCVFSGSGF